MVIMMILASFIIGGARKVREMALEKRAKTDFAAVEAAIMQFKADTGEFPPMGPWLCNRFKSRLEMGYYINDGTPLLNNVTGQPITGWKGPYMHFKQEDLEPPDYDNYYDPWGTIYFYGMPGEEAKSGEHYFDLWSAGPDTESDSTRPETELDDINNW